MWKIESEKSYLDKDDYLNHGFEVKNGKIYIVTGFYFFPPLLKKLDLNENLILLREFYLNGNLIRKREIKSIKVSKIVHFLGYKIPFSKNLEIYEFSPIINDIGIDKRGNIYIKIEDLPWFDKAIVVLGDNLEQKGYIRTVLKRGFEKPKPVYSKEMKRMVDYVEELSKIGLVFHLFNTSQLSFIPEAGPGLYYANSMVISPDDKIYATFTGYKPFGIIDAMVFNLKGDMIGYWKQQERSYSEWYRNMQNTDKGFMDLELHIAFYKDYIFICRTIQDLPYLRHYNLIQKFIKGVRK